MSRASHDHLLTRRQTLGVAGAAGAAYFLSSGRGPTGLLGRLGSVDDAAAASCVLTPAKTEGPYFVDERLNRSDIRADPSNGSVQSGVPLRLNINVFRADASCAPEQGAYVDIWHASAQGLYSDESANGTAGRKFLRGFQVTDASGAVSFLTVYPGWYSGRAVHIHLKVRTFSGTTKTFEFTSQVFFDDAQSDQVMAQTPYNSRGSRDTRNSNDNIYGSDGSQLTVPLTADGSGGYVGTFSLGLSGLPSSGGTTGGTDHSVQASLSSAKFGRTARGTRVLSVSVKASERVSADAKLVRGSTILARKQVAKVGPGTRTLRLSLGRGVAAGSARLRVTLKDSAGNSKLAKKTLRVPSP